MSHSSITTSNHFLCHFLGNLEFWLPILTAYLVITVFTLEDVRCVYQSSFTHISIPSSILPVWFQSVCSVFGAYSIPAAHSHILSGGTHYNQQQRLWCSFQALKSSLYGFAYFCAPCAQSPAKKYAYFKQHLWKSAYNYRHSMGHQTECVFIYGVRRNCVISNFFWTRLIETFLVRGCLVTH